MTKIPVPSAVVLLTTVTAACSFSTAEPEEKGDLHYQLVSFEGQSVPAVIQQNGDATLEILSGTFVLTPLGQCDGETRWRRTEGGETTSGQALNSCSWSSSGDDMSFTWMGGTESSGTSDGALLTVTLPTGLQCVSEPCPVTWSATYQYTPM